MREVRSRRAARRDSLALRLLPYSFPLDSSRAFPQYLYLNTPSLGPKLLYLLCAVLISALNHGYAGLSCMG